MKHNRLKRRGAVYYFRVKIPVDLIDHYGKREILESLRTKDLREAVRMERSRSLQQDEEFDRIRAGRKVTELTDEQIQAIADEHYAGLLYWDEREREQGLSDEDYEARSAEVTSVDSFAPAALARNDVKRGGYITHLALKWRGITLPKDSASYRKLTYALLKVTVRANDAVRARQEGKVVDTPRAPATILATSSSKANGVTLATIIERWAKENTPRERTLFEWRRIVRDFTEATEGVALHQLTRAHVVAYKNSLVDAGKAPATTWKNVMAINTLLRWAASNEMVTTNGAQGVTVKHGKRAKSSRLPYSEEDMRLIFSSPIYTKGERPSGGKGEAAFWLPLLAAHTGARREELCQLRREGGRGDQLPVHHRRGS